jgi:serine/threonine-protein kinase
MELLEGSTLEEILEEQQRLDIQVALEIGIQLASALAAVHEKGIVHRDLKPANVFLVAKKTGGFLVKLLDFGVAKMVSGDDGPKVNTAVGSLMGTPDYMAPEATMGLEVDHRADIYSLGCVLYQMVTGRLPFLGEEVAEVLELHRSAAPTPPQELAKVPEKLALIILLCLAKKPDQRPSSAELLLRGLRVLRPRRDSTVVRWATFIGILLLAASGWMLIDMSRGQERIVIPANLGVVPPPSAPPAIEQPALRIDPEPEPEPEALAEEPEASEEPTAKKRSKRKTRARKRAKAEPEAVPPPPPRETIDRAETKANPYD